MDNDHQNIIKDFDSIEEINQMQLRALNLHLEYVYTKSPFYKDHWKRVSEFKGINSLDQLKEFPITSKSDFQKDEFQFLCVPRKEVVEYVTTSGSTGSPIVVALTQSDLKRLAYNEKRSLEIAGVSSEDIVQITTTLDKLFMAGMAYYQGVVAIGATVLRIGITQPAVQLKVIRDFHSSVMIAVPSYINSLKRFALKNKTDINSLPVKKIICIGDVIRESNFERNALHNEIVKDWNVELFSTYASTESMTAFTECSVHRGGHLIPELMVVEILDEDDLTVEDGDLGEVVVTPLGVTGMPIVRYKTGDLARLHTGKCDCGRSTPRLGPIEGRKNHMIKLKGTTIYPSSIESVLHHFQELKYYLIEITQSEIGLDSVNLILEDTISNDLINEIRIELSNRIRVVPEISRIESSTLRKRMYPVDSRKPIKVIDLR